MTPTHSTIPLSIYLSTPLAIYLSICLSLYLSICLSIYLPDVRKKINTMQGGYITTTHSTIPLSIYLFNYLPYTPQSLYLPYVLYLSIYLSTICSLSICLSIYLPDVRKKIYTVQGGNMTPTHYINQTDHHHKKESKFTLIFWIQNWRIKDSLCLHIQDYTCRLSIIQSFKLPSLFWLLILTFTDILFILT